MSEQRLRTLFNDASREVKLIRSKGEALQRQKEVCTEVGESVYADQKQGGTAPGLFDSLTCSMVWLPKTM